MHGTPPSLSFSILIDTHTEANSSLLYDISTHTEANNILLCGIGTHTEAKNILLYGIGTHTEDMLSHSREILPYCTVHTNGRSRLYAGYNVTGICIPRCTLYTKLNEEALASMITL